MFFKFRWKHTVAIMLNIYPITPSYTGQYNGRKQEGISVYQILSQYRRTYSIQHDKHTH